MDMFKLLKQDHDMVKTDLSSLIRNCDAGQDVNFDKLLKCREDLLLHMQVEEEILYPEAEKVQRARDLIHESYKEHKGVRDLLEKIDRTMETRQLGEYLHKILDDTSHHIQEEEGQLFPILQKEWSEQQIMQMGNRISDRKEQQTGVKR